MVATTLTERGIAVAGVRSRVLEGGRDASEAVVFVHGNPGSSREWVPFGTAASEFARVLVPEMPGFGRADKPPDFEYTVAGYARHLGGLLDACGIRRAHLVLHDFGCTWGLTWAAAHPDACASVVLVDAGFLPGYRWHWFGRAWRTPGLGEAFQLATTRMSFRLLIGLGNPRLPRDFVDAMYDDYDAGTRRAVLRLYRATDDLGQITVPLAKVLRPLDKPALVIWGQDDPYISSDYAERQRDGFPSAQVVVIPRSAHWPHGDAAEAFRNALLPFLRGQAGGPRPASG